MKRVLPILTAIVFFTMLFSGHCFAQQKDSNSGDLPYKIFRLKHRKASSVEEIVKLYMSSEGKMAIDKRTNSVIVRDHPENLARIADIINDVDKPVPQVRVHVKFLGRKQTSGSGIFATSQKTGNNWKVCVHPGLTSATSNRTANLNLAIMSGESGFIKVGKKVPYPTWFYKYSFHHGYVTKGVVFQDVSTGFYVTPHVREDRIKLKIAPGIKYFDGNRWGQIIYREAQTTITVKEGQSVVVGVSESGDRETRGLISKIVGAKQLLTNEVFSMVLSVDIIKEE